MDPEFKEYLDAWFARLERGLDHLLTLRAAVPSPAVSSKAGCVTESAPASSGTAELVTAADTTDINLASASSSSTSAWSNGCCVTEVPAPAFSSPDHDAFFPSRGVTTVELLREGVPEPVLMSAALQGSSSSLSIVKETIGIDPAVCTGFITTAPATCSTDCLPGPSFKEIIGCELPSDADGDGTRPLPWPSFGEVNGVVSTEFASDVDGGERGASVDDNSVHAIPCFVVPVLSITAGNHNDSTPSPTASNQCSTYGATAVSFPASAPEASIILQDQYKYDLANLVNIFPIGLKSLNDMEIFWNSSLDQNNAHLNCYPLTYVLATTRSCSGYKLLDLAADLYVEETIVNKVFSGMLSADEHQLSACLNAEHPIQIQAVPLQLSIAYSVLRIPLSGSAIICVVVVPLEDANAAAYLNLHAVCIELVGKNEQPNYITADSCKAGIYLVFLSSPVDREEQFNSFGVSWNILEKILKKLCAESEEAILSGLIGRYTHPEVQHLNDSVPGCVQQYIFALFQWEIAWQPKVEGECFDIGVHYCHGNIFEGCPSSYMPMVMLLYGNYSHMNSWAWYTVLHCTTASVVQMCTLMYGNQCSAWGIISATFLKCNHYICCWYALKPCSPVVHMVYTYLLLLPRPYSELPIEICLHELHLTRRGMEAGLHSFYESTSRPLLQALGIPDNNKKMGLCMTARESFILQNQGHSWMSHGFVLICCCRTTLLSAQGADEDGIVTRKHSIVTVQRMEAPWDPGGSTWCRWFSPCDKQGPFQGGRLMPTFDRHKELRLPWDSGGAATGDQLNKCSRQWDPGGFSGASAWGQAEFQGGRDVRSLSLSYRYWAGLMGCHMGLGRQRPSGAARYIYEGGVNAEIIQDGSGTAAADLLSHLALIPFFLHACSSCLVLEIMYL